MICPYCRNMIDADSAYCGYCGANVRMQNTVSTNYTEYAGFWRRVAASLLDGLILAIPMWVIGFVFGMLMVALGLRLSSENGMMAFTGSLYLLMGVGVWLYCALMESSDKGATLGKQALGIRVISQNGGRLSFSQATGRHFGKILSSLILGIGYVMAGFTEQKQALHDMLAGCLVVKEPR